MALPRITLYHDILEKSKQDVKKWEHHSSEAKLPLWQSLKLPYILWGIDLGLLDNCGGFIFENLK